jgi:hypothetical protein
VRRLAWARTSAAFASGFAAGWAITLLDRRALATILLVGVLVLELASPRLGRARQGE